MKDKTLTIHTYMYIYVIRTNSWKKVTQNGHHTINNNNNNKIEENRLSLSHG